MAETRTRRRRSSSSSRSRGSSGAFPKIDFRKEESSGGGKRFREDDYLVKAIKAKPGVSENKRTPYIEFTFVFLDGKYKKQKMQQRIYTSPKALWLLRSYIEAVGEEVPASAADWKKIAKLVLSKEVIATLTDNENPDSGRITSQVADFLDPEEFDGDEDDDLDDDEDDDLDDDEDDDLDDDEDVDDDEDEIEDEDDDEDDEEDEPEPEPKRRRRSSSRKSSAKKSSGSRRRKKDDEDDDLEDIDLDDL